jgi:aromatic ring-cleaving dioxygenase
MSDHLHDRIAKRAYEIYQQRTRQGALDDWLKAEREILRHPHAGDPVMPHRGGYTGEEQE